MSIIVEKKNIRHLTVQELNAWLDEQGEKGFRKMQVHEWLWQKGARAFDVMSNLPKPLRDAMQTEFSLPSLSLDAKQQSNDGTIKVRFKTYDGHFIEGVLIPADDRVTACVSSQVGCSLTCSFCATGKMGRKRNLHFDEIFDQVDNLRWFPYLGRSGAKENMRELVIQKHYLVSYRIKEDTIEILQVWHTAKDR